MDWSRRAAWLYQGSSPDYPKLAAHAIGTIYVDARDDNAKAIIDDARSHGLQAGIYYDPHWFGGLTPQQQAKKVSDYVQVAKLVAVGDPVMIDLELLSIAWVQAFVQSYRSYLPSRPTALTRAP